MPFALIDRWRAPAPDPRKVAWIGAQAYAHRGLHDEAVPENSRAAFARAIAGGFGIECDVRRTSDGQVVVFHDPTLGRLAAETGPVSRRSAAQLGAITLAGSAETIPTLRQVLADVDGRMPILIEVKVERDTRIAALCLAVRRGLEGYLGPHAVMSFDPRVARWFARHSAHTVRGLILTEGEDRALAGRLRRHALLWAARPEFLAYDVRDLPSRFAAAQRRRGLPVLTWTVRTAEHRERAALYTDAAIFEGEPPASALSVAGTGEPASGLAQA